MAIKRIAGVAGPAGSIPTARGWIHPKTGELLKSQRITQEQLDEWNGVQVLAEPVIHDPEPAIDEIIEDEEAETEIVEEAPKPKKKSKKQSKKFSLFG